MNKISSNIFPIKKIFSKTFPAKIETNLIKSFNNDIFIKCDDIDFDKRLILKLYDEIYSDVIGQNVKNNPVLSSVIINKPKISFKEQNFDECSILYSSYNNEIIINPNFLKENFFAIFTINKDKSDGEIYNFCEEKSAKEELKRAKQKSSYAYALKLNSDEKRIMFRCALAHELRHCIQNHLILCCEGGHKDFKEEINAYINKFKELQNDVIKAGGKSLNSDIKTLENCYLFSYKPAIILDKNAKFKVSLDNDDDRYWSIYDDFVNSDSSFYVDDKFSADKYFSSIIEKDAYNYEHDYCKSHLSDFKKTSAREEVINALLEASYQKANFKSKI